MSAGNQNLSVRRFLQCFRNAFTTITETGCRTCCNALLPAYDITPQSLLAERPLSSSLPPTHTFHKPFNSPAQSQSGRGVKAWVPCGRHSGAHARRSSFLPRRCGAAYQRMQATHPKSQYRSYPNRACDTIVVSSNRCRGLLTL